MNVNRFVLSCFSHIQLFMTLWTVDHQAPLSMGFSRQEYWSGLPFPTPGDLPDPGIKLVSLMSPFHSFTYSAINLEYVPVILYFRKYGI